MEEVDRFSELLGIAKAQSGFFHKKQFDHIGLKNIAKHQKQGAFSQWDAQTYRLTRAVESALDSYHFVQLLVVDKNGWPATAFCKMSALYLHGLCEPPEKYYCRAMRKISVDVPPLMVLDRFPVDSESLEKIDGLWTTDLATTLSDLLNAHLDYRAEVADAVVKAVNAGRLNADDLTSLNAKTREFINIVAGWTDKRTKVLP